MNTYVTKLKKFLKERETRLSFYSGEEVGSLWVEEDSLYLSLDLRFRMKVKDIIPSKDYDFYDVIGFNSVLSKIKFGLGMDGTTFLEGWDDLPILVAERSRVGRLIVEGNDVYSYLTDKLFGEVLVKKKFYCKRTELIQNNSNIRREGKSESMYIQEIYLYLGWGEQ